MLIWSNLLRATHYWKIRSAGHLAFLKCSCLYYISMGVDKKTISNFDTTIRSPVIASSLKIYSTSYIVFTLLGHPNTFPLLQSRLDLRFWSDDKFSSNPVFNCTLTTICWFEKVLNFFYDRDLAAMQAYLEVTSAYDWFSAYLFSLRMLPPKVLGFSSFKLFSSTMVVAC